jgi:hypothetical protein
MRAMRRFIEIFGCCLFCFFGGWLDVTMHVQVICSGRLMGRWEDEMGSV